MCVWCVCVCVVCVCMCGVWVVCVVCVCVCGVLCVVCCVWCVVCGVCVCVCVVCVSGVCCVCVCVCVWCVVCVCVCVFLPYLPGMQITYFLQHIILPSVASLPMSYFSTLSHKPHYFRKTSFSNIKCGFKISLQSLSEIFLNRRWFQPERS